MKSFHKKHKKVLNNTKLLILLFLHKWVFGYKIILKN